ncbi:hypothetical protein CBM2592_U10033 [Cupriavidus taiwanensis]|nr:hypothetical protein CBM2592_U10033 [Cupriavidus taiwanensis]SOZ00999.1 hypothetical protein CBM2591_U10035 [Cupriavidus taiwanensis]
MPVALISTSTSPARGPSRSTPSMVSGFPAPQATAARVFIDLFYRNKLLAPNYRGTGDRDDPVGVHLSEDRRKLADARYRDQAYRNPENAVASSLTFNTRFRFQ